MTDSGDIFASLLPLLSSLDESLASEIPTLATSDGGSLPSVSLDTDTPLTSPSPLPSPAASSFVISSTPGTPLISSSVPTSTAPSPSSSDSASSMEITSTIQPDSSTFGSSGLPQSMTTLVKSTTSSSSAATSSPTPHPASTKGALTSSEKIGIAFASVFGTLLLVAVVWLLIKKRRTKQSNDMAREEAFALEESFAVRKRKSDLEKWKQGGPPSGATVPTPSEEPRGPIRRRTSVKYEALRK